MAHEPAAIWKGASQLSYTWTAPEGATPKNHFHLLFLCVATMRQALANDPELGAVAKLPAYSDLMELLNDHVSLSALLTVYLENLRRDSPAFQRAWDRVVGTLKQQG